MRFFVCVAVALCVALAAAETDVKETAKTKRYTSSLSDGIESKLAYTSSPFNADYQNFENIFNGAQSGQAFSSLQGISSPQFYSGLGKSQPIQSYSSFQGLSSPQFYSGLSKSQPIQGYSSFHGFSSPQFYSGLGELGASGLTGFSGVAKSGLYNAGYSTPSLYSGLAASGLGYGYGAAYANNYAAPQVYHTPVKELGPTQNVQYRTVTQHVPVPVAQPYPVEVAKPVSVPQPYPVHVPKPVPVPVKVEVPVDVPRPYPVKVPQPVPVQVPVKVPVEVPRPYPVTVTKTVQVPVDKPVYVKYPVQYPVAVPQAYPVEVHQPVPVKVPQPVVVKEPHYEFSKSIAYLQPVGHHHAYPTSYAGLKSYSHYTTPYVPSSVYPATYAAGLKTSAVYPASYASASVYPGSYSSKVYSHGLHSSSVVPSTSYHTSLNGDYNKAIYPYSHNYNSYGKYLSGERQYINAQPLNYLRDGSNDYGLLKSYIPSVHGGYNGFNTEHSHKK